MAGSSILHLLQLPVRVESGGGLLAVRHPEVRVPSHHDHERDGHVLHTGKNFILKGLEILFKVIVLSVTHGSEVLT